MFSSKHLYSLFFAAQCKLGALWRTHYTELKWRLNKSIGRDMYVVETAAGLRLKMLSPRIEARFWAALDALPHSLFTPEDDG